MIELILTRIEQRVPAPYLTGVAWFCNLPFVVDERVLIPRSPIGQMIDQGFAPWWQGHTLDGQPQPQRIMDLCTGSGCIGIATAYAFPYARVDLADISEEALCVARSNVTRHDLADQVTVYQSDLFDDLPEDARYDLIVSNPPYVPQQEYDDASYEVTDFEPATALVSGDDGLDHIRLMLLPIITDRTNWQNHWQMKKT